MVAITSTSRVNIIILNYNCWDDSIDCIKSVLNSTYKDFQIFLIDNNSSNKSEEKLIQYLSENSVNSLSLKNKDKALEYQYFRGVENFHN